MNESTGTLRLATAGTNARRRWARAAARRQALRDNGQAGAPRFAQPAQEDVGMQWAIAWFRNTQAGTGSGACHVAA